MVNGPQFVEAANAMAYRVLGQHGGDEWAAVGELFRMLTGRPPDDRQLATLVELFQSQQEHFGQHTDARDAYLEAGQWRPPASADRTRLAALSTVASTLRNYDICITKR